MATETLEDRVAIIEKELAQIKQQLAPEKPQTVPHPWNKVFGSFANSEGFEGAVRLGREYRDLLRPKDSGAMV